MIEEVAHARLILPPSQDRSRSGFAATIADYEHLLARPVGPPTEESMSERSGLQAAVDAERSLRDNIDRNVYNPLGDVLQRRVTTLVSALRQPSAETVGAVLLKASTSVAEWADEAKALRKLAKTGASMAHLDGHGVMVRHNGTLWQCEAERCVSARELAWTLDERAARDQQTTRGEG
jgi:hypothetical protein